MFRAAAGRTTWRLRRSGRDSALSLAPRLGRRPSLELHLRTRRYLLKLSWAGAGPGPVQGAGTLLSGCRALTPSQRPARRQWRQQGRQLRSRLPRSSARSRGSGECCCCGWPRPPPPLSPYRTRGPDCVWLSAPAITAPLFPEVAKQARESRTPIGEGRGGSARAGSGGRGRGTGPAGPQRRPSLLSRLLPRSPSASAAPHYPVIFSAPHTRTPPPPSTTATAAHGARRAAAEASAHTARPCRRPAHTAGPTAGPSPRASPPSPRLHAPL